MKQTGLFLSLGFLLLWVIAFRPVILGGRTSYIIVSGRSMEPTLYGGDLAVLLRQPAYQPGDVIAYRLTSGQVIHRIVAVTAAGYQTQGDNKQQIDPWTPLDEHVLGKMWFSIPHAGTLLVGLRQPVSLAVLTLLGVLVILEEPAPRRMRKNGRRMKTNTWSTPTRAGGLLRSRSNAPAISGEVPLDLTWLLYTGGLFLLMAILSLALAVYSHRQPLTQTAVVDWLRYTHRAAFQYSVQADLAAPGVAGTLGPIRAAEGQTVAAQAAFTRLARTITIDLHYRLESSLPASVQGEISPQLQLRRDGLVLASRPLGDALPFSGGEIIRQVNLPVADVLALIQSIQEQTGYNSTTYDAAVVFLLRLSGSVGDRTIDDGLQPALTFQINDSQIRFEPLADWSEEKVIQDSLTTPNQIGIGRLRMNVRDLRPLSLWLAGLSLLGALLASLMLYWALRGDENSRIRTRYGGLIVSVAEMQLHSERVVQVGSFGDLVRLSQRFNCMILHRVQSDRSHLYLIADGDVLYAYRVKAGLVHRE